MFSPSFTKEVYSVGWISDDTAKEYLSDGKKIPVKLVKRAGDNETTEGFLSVRFNRGGQIYVWPDITLGQFYDFEEAEFSERWLNDNLEIVYRGGDWGWPYHRTEGSGWWEGQYVSPKGEDGEYYDGRRRPKSPKPPL